MPPPLDLLGILLLRLGDGELLLTRLGDELRLGEALRLGELTLPAEELLP